MTNLKFLTILSLLLAGCVSMADYERMRGERDYYRMGKGGATPNLDGDGAAPDATGLDMDGMVSSKQGYTATQWASAWVTRPHGAYLCFIGQDPHVTVGRKFRVKNAVCDQGSRNLSGDCRDDYGVEQYHTWVAMANGGNPVIVLAPMGGLWQPNFHPSGDGTTVLPPKATCTFELGSENEIQLEVGAYRNFGSRSSPALEGSPDTTYSHGFPFGTLSGSKEYQIDESRF